MKISPLCKLNWGRVICITLLSLLLVGLLNGCGSNSEKESTVNKADEQTNFPQKDITFVVPVSPGGGFDVAARTLAPYLEKYLPNDVNVMVKNMPGGEWAIGINEVYKANPDGYTIGIFNLPGNVLNQVMGTVNYDLNKITWLGRVESIVYVTAISPYSKYQNLEDLKSAPKVNVGTVGATSTASLGTLIAAKAMGINNLNFIPHDGSSEAVLSAIRGDVDWVQYPFATLRQHIVDSNDLNALLVYAEERLEDLPDVPTVKELGYPELVDIVTMHRLVGTTPGVPDDVVAILSEAFQNALNDPEFIKQMQNQSCTVDPTGADKALNIIENSIKLIEQYKEEIQ